jgi:hypothetical protein
MISRPSPSSSTNTSVTAPLIVAKSISTPMSVPFGDKLPRWLSSSQLSRTALHSPKRFTKCREAFGWVPSERRNHESQAELEEQ